MFINHSTHRFSGHVFSFQLRSYFTSMYPALLAQVAGRGLCDSFRCEVACPRAPAQSPPGRPRVHHWAISPCAQLHGQSCPWVDEPAHAQVHEFPHEFPGGRVENEIVSEVVRLQPVHQRGSHWNARGGGVHDEWANANSDRSAHSAHDDRGVGSSWGHKYNQPW